MCTSRVRVALTSSRRSVEEIDRIAREVLRAK
jgi:hypothetical protein